MKKNDAFLAISLGMYSYLFYHQSMGINFLLFSLFQVVFFYFLYPERIKKTTWKLSAAGVIVTGVSLMLHGSVLGFIANIVSICALAFTSIKPGTSLVMGLFNSLYSIIGAGVFLAKDSIVKAEAKANNEKEKKKYKTLLIVAISFVIALVFFGLYRSSNAVFKNLTDNIDFSFISAQWIGFTMLGFFILYGIYKYRGVEKLQAYDIETSNDLERSTSENSLDKLMSLETEKKAGVILLIMLNALLFFVNLTDSIFLLGGAELPEGMNYSDMVHQGVNALITSILMAVAIILFFFRGRLNFIRDNQHLLRLSYLWIAQNAIIVLFTAYRNHLYIQEAFLTYKRIGVYIYLALCVIGLGYTFIKLRKTKTNWYIVRYVGWSFYSILIVAPMVNWDSVIINYNFSRANEKPEALDVSYLLSLEANNLPHVYQKMEEYDKGLLIEFADEIEENAEEIIEYQKIYDWRSFSFKDQNSYNGLSSCFSKEKLEYLKKSSQESYEHYNYRALNEF